MKHQTKFYAAACVAFAIVLLCLAPLKAQQTRGVVLGRVSDQSAAVVPDAQVTLLNEKTGISSSSTTGAQGDYTFTNVEPGTSA
jgi:protocatechuate 3,4-dioxygenase beta subunit